MKLLIIYLIITSLNGIYVVIKLLIKLLIKNKETVSLLEVFVYLLTSIIISPITIPILFLKKIILFLEKIKIKIK